MAEALKVGDLVTGDFFRGEKRLTYVDNQSVMVQITPVYEQAYFPHQVRKVDPQPEKCRACAGEVSAADLSKDDDLPLCDRHWAWWVVRFVGPETFEPPCSAHLIPEPTNSGMCLDCGTGCTKPEHAAPEPSDSEIGATLG